ncbi:error-prone DNA polymerase (plasmid) [Amycolatopsis sp. FU40]|uniref:error-prone DNA polymerase n=1 Tax=Amycolatopsis sp. FU40 TaxID=2914159 RepID=UPI001F206A43|nr:error-prone DNA polymerase [Amycolatopsis sp. FU40]UKD50941.1 error-prone DNA polymerase [Amycolatopsis sp. FU40]
MSWSELERLASGRAPAPGAAAEAPVSRKRDGYRRPDGLIPKADAERAEPRVPYAELHCHSNFSFLDGVDHPEALAEEAVRHGLDALVLTDHDGMYGAARFAEAAKELGLRTGFGAELSLGLPARQSGVADPAGTHLLTIARNLEGYRRLCRVISRAQLAGEKGRPVYDVDELVEELRGHVLVPTGCRKSAVRRALAEKGPAAAADEVRRLADWFGAGHVAVELIDHGQPLDSTHNDMLAGIAADLGLPTIATNAVHYTDPDRGRHADMVAAIRANTSIDELEGWLPADNVAFLRSGAEMADVFRRYPGAVGRAAQLGVEVSFELDLLAPSLPPFPVPPEFPGEAAYLRHLAYAGAAERYGSRANNPRAYDVIEHELGIIEQLGFPGYFLVVWDIVRFCRERGILAQGRGSAANSAVCFALRISNVDAVKWNLLFERFLSPERDGPPDIDVDIESARREEAIQYVYETHGRFHAAQVANVITYKSRSAVREAAKALGYSQGQQDAFGKQVDRWGSIAQAKQPDQRGHGIPDDVLEFAAWLEDTPRHLGVHSGGMVIADTPVSEIVPVEWATAENRSVLQWDKDDCASIGLVKFDLLGLGMLSALHYTIDLVAEHHGRRVDLGELDLADDAVYDMLCNADAIGVFQVESRAQLNTLPRLRPREFYDLVVEVALIRPGPIQGGSVHPYIRRRRGEENWAHPHPSMAAALDRTLGVPLFQEQVMQLARDCAGFTPGEADELRRAMGSKRSAAKMRRLAGRFVAGTDATGIPRPLARRIFEQIEAFAGYGFPEAHSMAFALLVYASAWFKLYYPAAFCAGLLRAQPMGFYSPQSLVADARRHGVATLQPDLNLSAPHATLEADPGSAGGVAIRLGLAGIRHVGQAVAEQIVADRDAGGPYTSIGHLTDRVQLTKPVVEALATAGVFTALGPDRRQALWAAGAAATTRPGHLPGLPIGHDAPALPGMTAFELASADLWATGVTADSHPVEFLRAYLERLGAIPAERLLQVEDGTRVKIGGAVTHRQRPASAGGVTFLNLEDETGMVNVVVSQGLWNRERTALLGATALLVRGTAQVSQGAASLQADQISVLDLKSLSAGSRDFR